MDKWPKFLTHFLAQWFSTQCTRPIFIRSELNVKRYQVGFLRSQYSLSKKYYQLSFIWACCFMFPAMLNGLWATDIWSLVLLNTYNVDSRIYKLSKKMIIFNILHLFCPLHQIIRQRGPKIFDAFLGQVVFDAVHPSNFYYGRTQCQELLLPGWLSSKSINYLKK